MPRDEPARDAGVDLSGRLAFIEHVASQRAPVLKDDLILAHCTDRTVLDLGCIDHSAVTASSLGSGWLHARIREVARELVGIDILSEDAAILNARGFDIEVGDVERLDLGRTFDVVIAGDLIEHLSNIGQFLDSVSRHMHSGSRFVITTPNPFNIEQTAQAVFRGQVMVNDEHTVWLDPRVMHQLIARSPLEIVDFHWVDTRFHFPLTGGRVLPRIVNPITRAVMRRRPLVRRDYAVVARLASTPP